MVQKATLPEALYACADTDCAAEVSWPPNMLYWWALVLMWRPLGSTAKKSGRTQTTRAARVWPKNWTGG